MEQQLAEPPDTGPALVCDEASAEHASKGGQHHWELAGCFQSSSAAVLMGRWQIMPSLDELNSWFQAGWKREGREKKKKRRNFKKKRRERKGRRRNTFF